MFKHVLGLALSMACLSAQAGLFGDPEGKSAECLQSHSRAWCALDAAGLSGGAKDMKPDQIADYVAAASRRNASQAASGALLAASATGLLAPPVGIPSAGNLAMLFIGAMGNSSPYVVRQNYMFGWAPQELGANPDDVDEALHQILHAAILKGLATRSPALVTSNSVGKYSLDDIDRPAWKIADGQCVEAECTVYPVYKRGTPGIVGGGVKSDTRPAWLGSGNTLARVGTGGTVVSFAVLVGGRNINHLILPLASHHLPEGLFLSTSPERKVGDSVFNEGQPIPIVYEKGRALYLAFPEVQ